MAKRAPRIPISKRAVFQRINRALKEEDQQLRQVRWNARRPDNFGDFYVIDTRRNVIVHTDVDPEEFARELKVMADWETLTED